MADIQDSCVACLSMPFIDTEPMLTSLRAKKGLCMLRVVTACMGAGGWAGCQDGGRGGQPQCRAAPTLLPGQVCSQHMIYTIRNECTMYIMRYMICDTYDIYTMIFSCCVVCLTVDANSFGQSQSFYILLNMVSHRIAWGCCRSSSGALSH